MRFDVSGFKVGGKGCCSVKVYDWIEILGCGVMVHLKRLLHERYRSEE